jgi:putative ABC transport system ATP-binding protein
MSAVLEMRGLIKSVGTPARTLLNGLTLDVNAGEVVAVRGRSGSGKSTLLNMAGGLDLAYDGDIRVDGHDLKRLSDAQRSHLRLKTVGMVFQAFHLMDHLTILQNVLLPTRFARAGERDTQRGRALELLRDVGMGDRSEERPNILSGGERQRVAIARALLMRPRLLLADEPTGNLDKTTADGVLDVFSSLVKSAGTGVLLVTHDASVAARAARTVIIDGGTAHAQDAA